MGNDRRRREVTTEEAKLWRDAMRGTHRLVQPTAAGIGLESAGDPAPPASSPSPIASKPAGRPKDGRKTVVRPFPEDKDSPPASPGYSVHPAPPCPQALDHRRAPGLDKGTAGRLAKGMMAIDAVIDLHGLTQPVAHAALSRFIAGSADLGRRCVLVITGKGSREGAGILRAEVPRWLTEPALKGLILAFTPAQPKHGGGGALYVLLKRRR